jgi:ATP-binding cassette subfamily G (WHITE) protein 2 (SNQ2)
VPLIPPPGQTCGAYLQDFINRIGGYVQDPSATSSCEFCPFANTDQLMAVKFFIFWSHHWRDMGFLAGYIAFNVSAAFFACDINFNVIWLIAMIYVIAYLFRIRTWRLPDALKVVFMGRINETSQTLKICIGCKMRVYTVHVISLSLCCM